MNLTDKEGYIVLRAYAGENPKKEKMNKEKKSEDITHQNIIITKEKVIIYELQGRRSNKKK